MTHTDTELASRLALWRTAPSRLAVSGGRSTNLAETTLAALRAEPTEVLVQPLFDPSGAVAEDVADADVLISGGAVIDTTVARQLRRTRFVLRPYVGYDDIDVDALTEQGILFANVPDTFIEEVANHTMALILGGNRRLTAMDTFMRDGRWSAGERARGAGPRIRRLSALTLGLVGFGNIARLVVERARPFGFDIVAADPYVSEDVAAASGVHMMDLDELMQTADIVSLHVFLNAETRGLIDARRLALMKPEAYLVNTSRGPVVDEAALIDVLRQERITGAGLDVFEIEPVTADNPLLRMPNVVLTPHVASYSEEGDIRHQQRIAELAVQVMRGELPERKVVVNKTLYDQYAQALGR